MALVSYAPSDEMVPEGGFTAEPITENGLAGSGSSLKLKITPARLGSTTASHPKFIGTESLRCHGSPRVPTVREAGTKDSPLAVVATVVAGRAASEHLAPTIVFDPVTKTEGTRRGLTAEEVDHTPGSNGIARSAKCRGVEPTDVVEVLTCSDPGDPRPTISLIHGTRHPLERLGLGWVRGAWTRRWSGKGRFHCAACQNCDCGHTRDLQWRFLHPSPHDRYGREEDTGVIGAGEARGSAFGPLWLSAA